MAAKKTPDYCYEIANEMADSWAGAKRKVTIRIYKVKRIREIRATILSLKNSALTDSLNEIPALQADIHHLERMLERGYDHYEQTIDSEYMGSVCWIYDDSPGSERQEDGPRGNALPREYRKPRFINMTDTVDLVIEFGSMMKLQANRGEKAGEHGIGRTPEKFLELMGQRMIRVKSHKSEHTGADKVKRERESIVIDTWKNVP